jgi:Tol biopolymer transport system component
VTPIDGTGEPKQVTFSTTGIFDFAVSPSGRQLVYSQRRSDEPITDLMLLDLGSGESSLLVDCSGADCTAPAWRADELMLAYTRADTSRLLQGQGVSPDRVWLLDLTTTPPNTSPLFEESQILGYAPQWSMNGSRIAMFDNNTPGIVVYDFLTETMDVIATEQGSIGALSPDGSQLVYPQLVFDGARALSVLTLADLETNEVQRLSPNDTPVEDDMPQWSLDGQTLIFSRRYWDERYTFGTQLYGMDADQLGEAYPILVDETYTHGFFSLDPTAEQVVIQRFPVMTGTTDNPAMMRPSVWVYNRLTQQARELATNAFYPRWVP